MIQRLKYHHSMNSIKSLEDALAFKQETLVIPMETFGRFFSEEILARIQTKNNAACIFRGKGIYPIYFISSSDRFFRKTPEGLQEVRLEPGLILEDLYIQSPHIDSMTSSKGYHKLVNIFGNNIHLDRNRSATASLLGVHALFLYLKRENLHHVELAGLPIPSLVEIYPDANVEAWRDHQIAMRPKDPEELRKLPPICEQAFWDELVGTLSNQITWLINTIESFYEEDRDHFYMMRVDTDRVVIEKGIDHKYLPYYEQKFTIAEDHS